MTAEQARPGVRALKSLAVRVLRHRARLEFPGRP
jgi:hypothetical protein